MNLVFCLWYVMDYFIIDLCQHVSILQETFCAMNADVFMRNIQADNVLIKTWEKMCLLLAFFLLFIQTLAKN